MGASNNSGPSILHEASNSTVAAPSHTIKETPIKAMPGTKRKANEMEKSNIAETDDKEATSTEGKQNKKVKEESV